MDKGIGRAAPWALGAARAALAAVILVAILQGLSADAVGALALAALAVRVSAPKTSERIASVEALACVGLMAAMFGEGAAGAFAIGAALFAAPALVARLAARRTTQLALSAAWGAALVCIAGVLVQTAPERWAPFAALAPALAAATPRGALDALAAARLGEERWSSWRLHALAPLLVAMVLGAAFGGLAGAATPWAIGRLGTPAALLVLGGRARTAALGLGALAAGFVAAIAGAAAMAAGGAGAVLLAAPVFVLGLRVHAPGLGLEPRPSRAAQLPASAVPTPATH
jgi:hypothetical protein